MDKPIRFISLYANGPLLPFTELILGQGRQGGKILNHKALLEWYGKDPHLLYAGYLVIRDENKFVFNGGSFSIGIGNDAALNKRLAEEIHASSRLCEQIRTIYSRLQSGDLDHVLLLR